MANTELKKIPNFTAVRTVLKPVGEIAADNPATTPIPSTWLCQPTAAGVCLYWNATGISLGNTISLDILVPNRTAVAAPDDFEWVIAAQLTALGPKVLCQVPLNQAAIAAIRISAVILAAGTNALKVWAAKA